MGELSLLFNDCVTFLQFVLLLKRRKVLNEKCESYFSPQEDVVNDGPCTEHNGQTNNDGSDNGWR